MRKINNYFEDDNSGVSEAAEVTAESPAGKKEKKPGGKKPVIITCIVLGALIVCAGVYFALDAAGITPASKRRAYLEAVHTSQVFLQGVSVDGVDISGLTLDEAEKRIEGKHAEDTFEDVKYTLKLSAEAKALKQEAEQAKLEEEKELDEKTAEMEAADPADGEDSEAAEGEAAQEEQPAAELPEVQEPEEPASEPLSKDAEGNYLLTKKDMEMSFNTKDVLAEALALGKDITDYEEAVAFVEDIAANGREFETTYTVNPASADKLIDAIAEDCYVDAVDAKFEFNNDITHSDELKTEEKFSYIDEKNGMELDKDALKAELSEKAENGEFGEIELPMKEIPAKVTKETLQSQITLRGTAHTEFKTSNANRVHNVTKAAGLINGVIVEPGETFSMNDTLGVRTQKNGWKLAGALSGGQVDVQQYGGGVCQVSTTLYNAVVKADLEIVYRQAHSEKSGYVDGGLDATINSVGNLIDFKWKNNTDSSIIIVAYTTKDKSIIVDIYGAPFSGEYDEIRLSSKLITKIQPSGEMVYQEDPTLAPGQQVVKVKRRVGSKWVSYKHYYKDGVEIKKEELATSVYRAYNGLTLVGPGTIPVTPPAVTPPQTTPTAPPTTAPTTAPTPTASPEA